MIKGVVAILLAVASSALAFSPQNPGALSQKSTVIENTIQSSWKMDEPAPEVRSSTWNILDVILSARNVYTRALFVLVIYALPLDGQLTTSSLSYYLLLSWDPHLAP